MDIPGIGPGSAGYQPIAPEAQAAPGRSLPDGIQQRIAAAKNIPLELLSDRRLAGELESLGLPPNQSHMTAAKALVMQGQQLTPESILQLEQALAGLHQNDLATASAVAYLLANHLPVTPQNVEAQKQHLEAPNGLAPEALSDEKLAGELNKLGLPPTQAHLTAAKALVMQGQPLNPQAIAHLEHAMAGLHQHDLAAAKAVAYLLSQNLPVTPESVALALGRHDAPDSAGSRLADLMEKVLDTLMPEGKDKAPGAESLKGRLLHALKGLPLPEGEQGKVLAGLKHLVHAMGSPEADLAKLLQGGDAEGITAEAQSRLVSLLEKAVSESPNDQAIKDLRDEIRFNQLSNAGHDQADPPPATLPLVWTGGSGEIRVYERPEGGKGRPGEGSGSTRVIMALNTDQLKAVRVDLLMARKQVNCHIVVQDPELAAFLSPFLAELKGAIQETGIAVNALDVRAETGTGGLPGKGPAMPDKGVDFYR